MFVSISKLVSEDVYEKHLKRSMKQAETAAKNSFHCKTPDCPGWCFFEDNVSFRFHLIVSCTSTITFSDMSRVLVTRILKS